MVTDDVRFINRLKAINIVGCRVAVIATVTDGVHSMACIIDDRHCMVWIFCKPLVTDDVHFINRLKAINIVGCRVAVIATVTGGVHSMACIIDDRYCMDWI